MYSQVKRFMEMIQKPVGEIAQAIMAMRKPVSDKPETIKSKARRAVEALKDDMKLQRGESLGSVFIHELPKKESTNVKKGRNLFDMLSTGKY